VILGSKVLIPEFEKELIGRNIGMSISLNTAALQELLNKMEILEKKVKKLEG